MTEVGFTTDRPCTSVASDSRRQPRASDNAPIARRAERYIGSEEKVVALLTAPPADLFSACVDQVERLRRWETEPGSLSEAQGDAEMDRWEALCRRVATEPAATARDLAGKAILMREDLNRFYPLKDYSTSDWRMMRAIVGDVIAFGTMAPAPREEAVAADALLIQAIRAHQAAHDAFGAVCDAVNPVAVREAGGDDSEEALAPAWEIWHATNDAAFQAWRDVFQYRPGTLDGLLALLRHIEPHLEGHRGIENEPDVLGYLVTSVMRLARPAAPHAVAADPIYAAIEKDRTLAAEHIRLLGISGSKPDDDPSWEPTNDAGDAQWKHWTEVLLATVPTTSAGCAALARYANEWSEREGLDLSEAGPKICALIGRSPMLAPDADGENEGDPLTIEGAASLDFEAYQLDTALRDPRAWAAELAEHSTGMHIADKLLRMGKAEAAAFVRDADRRDSDLPKTLLKALGCAHESFDGWARLLSVAESRFLVAASAAAMEDQVEAVEPVEASPPAEPKHGYLPAPAGICEGSYGLRVDDEGLGLHAPPGSSVFIEPKLPQGAGLAVVYRPGAGPRIWDLTHAYDPALFTPGEIVSPMLWVCDPITGQIGQIDATQIEKMHKVFGVYVPAEIGEKYGPAPTPLTVMEVCPEGMFEQVVSDRSAYPLLRPTETAIVDPNLREPTHGALCVLQWSGGSRSVLLTNRRALAGNSEAWWVDPVNRPRSREAWANRMGGVPTLFASDGPYDQDHLAEKIIGTVVGVLGRVQQGAAA